MNRIKTYFVLGILCIAASVSARDVNDFFSINERFSDSEVELQIAALSDVIDLKYTSEVKSLINNYLSSGRPGSERILSRSNYYFPIIDEIIRKHNLPLELKYLAVVESGLRPTVRSKAGAVGLWQFISSTAKMYDLKIASIQDDRQDVTKSTEAALLYLNDLHERFGDWGLALAAYNCGPGNINKAIRKSGGKKSYWEIRSFLPKETRRYLPKFVATMYVMTYFEQYGIDGSNKTFTEHSAFGLATLHHKTNFSKIASHSGISLKEIKKYNPSYKANYIPSSKSGNTLILPESYLLTFLTITDQLHKIKNVFYTAGSTFTLPLETELALASAVENTRVNNATKFLVKENTASFASIPAIVNMRSTKAQTITSNLRPKMLRLRKRQSLSSYINNSVISDRKTAMVSANGVVTYQN